MSVAQGPRELQKRLQATHSNAHQLYLAAAPARAAESSELLEG
eukprot:CAMPEP_0119087182 /NCGR_PEP_ID=MMETSP1178-20130426/140715_1 /TAXON_ID=33656 /ORGANISM="unid sp, Strain CCMP2000" /LENGTH=42 /DNA_ID= /DNA_START= /DNA_END= /DNA_ORIENTATION=